MIMFEPNYAETDDPHEEAVGIEMREWLENVRRARAARKSLVLGIFVFG